MTDRTCVSYLDNATSWHIYYARHSWTNRNRLRKREHRAVRNGLPWTIALVSKVD